MKNGTKPARDKSDFELGPEMPQSISAERAILGAVLLDNSCFWQTESMQCQDFHLHSHRVIYGRMMELVAEGRPIDFVTITDRLGQHKEIEMVGGVVYVTGLTDGLPRVKNIEQYVGMVKDKAALRALIHVCNTSVQKAYEPGAIAEELITEADRKICDIQGQGKTGPRHASVVVKEIQAEFDRVRAIDANVKAIGYTTGVISLDETTLGYHKGEMVLIAGETSHGKSSVMRQGVFANMFAGVRNLVFTYEVYGRSFVTNLLSPTSNISGTKLRDFRLMDDQAHLLGNKSEVEMFKSHLQTVNKWPLWIVDDARNKHIDHVCSMARAAIRKDGIEMIWLDQASLVNGTGENETQRMEYISKSLVSLANSENVPVIVLSQLHRDKDRQSGNRAPRIGDVKQASRLEEDANTEIFVWNEKNAEKEIDRHWLIVAKQRNGPLAKLPVTLDRAILWFEDGHK